MRVREVMTREAVTVGADTLVRDAGALLAARGFTMLPVVDGFGALVGVFTEADALAHRLPVDPRGLVHGMPPRQRTAPPHTVGGLVSTPPVVATPHADVDEVARRMVEHGARSVPVVDGTRLVGVITLQDLLRAVTRDDRVVAAEVRRRLRRYGGRDRWRVDAVDGRVSIVDELADVGDRHVAAVLAGAVPGVVAVDFPQAGLADAVDHR
ncbi:CBS domain-containing protein [Saccharothrix violaceirubra]|uniref:CBS domain-containing protein n=1 Tax=Saccharothrix violaceirubra TaxID=413306 RepID=A0A7W7T4B1_9PSEU|nr:CBS domain-containing protein [Saccharothrix violaceirubra]MBB4966071.1 CBS domain-containing protein [Saccharothrix violaceirubra]